MSTQPTARAAEPFGALVSEHRPSRDHARAYLLLVAFSLAAVFISLGWGVIRWYLAYTDYGPALVWRWSGPAFIVASASGLLCLAGLILASRHRGMEIRVHENGLVVVHGRKGTRIPWGEILSVRTSAIRYGPPGLIREREADLVIEYRGLGPDNPGHKTAPRRLRLTHALSGFEGLAAELKQRIYPHLVGAYSEAFNRGNAVSFGKLELTPDGVRVSKRVVPWKSLAGVNLDRGLLTIRAKEAGGAAIRIAAHRVPNVELCVQLIQYLSQRS